MFRLPWQPSTLRQTSFLIHDSFIPELGKHLQHMLSDSFRVIIESGTDNSQTVRRQYPAMQLVGLVLLILLIFLIRYLLQAKLTPPRVQLTLLPVQLTPLIKKLTLLGGKRQANR